MNHYKVYQTRDRDDYYHSFVAFSPHVRVALSHDAFPWPGQFERSPDGQWLVQIQKTGSGNNTILAYRVDAKTRRVTPLGDIGERAWEFYRRKYGEYRSRLYHRGFVLVRWDRQNRVLLEMSGSHITDAHWHLNGYQVWFRPLANDFRSA